MFICPGFTALGLQAETVGSSHTHNNLSTNRDIFGVLFPVTAHELVSFDEREKGYYREALPPAMVRIDEELGSTATRTRAKLIQNRTRQIFTYLPIVHRPPDGEHPILQTYLDVCLRGVLQWGGDALATDFLLNTFGWSSCYLNDAPVSRRLVSHTSQMSVSQLLIRQSDYLMK